MKTSRSGSIPISTRDLDGVEPNGHLIVLINDRMLRGPRWILVRARELQARAYDEATLAELAEGSPLADALNQTWSDWILDRNSWEQLLADGGHGVAARIAWCRAEHPPRRSQAEGAVREMKLAAALGEFRARLDEVSGAGGGSQIEGQVHQGLLGDALEQIGYEVTSNPVGVPDIVAKVRSVPGLDAAQDLLDRLREWQPASTVLLEVRQRLLGLELVELRELAQAMHRK